MTEEFDREVTARLLKQAREIAAHLKTETEEIKMEMERVLDGGEEHWDGNAGEKDARAISCLEEVMPRRSFWHRWRR